MCGQRLHIFKMYLSTVIYVYQYVSNGNEMSYLIKNIISP